VVTGAALIFFGYSFSSRSMENRAKETIEQQFASISRRFDQEFRSSLKRSISRMVDSTLLDDHLFASKAEKIITAKRVERLFAQTARDFPSYDSISFVDADGEFVVNTIGRVRQSRSTILSGLESAPELAHPGSSGAATTKLFKKISDIPLLLSSGNMEWFMPPREIQIEGPYMDENGRLVALASMAKLDLDTGEFGGAVFITVKLAPFLSIYPRRFNPRSSWCRWSRGWLPTRI
jgi:hypothetical protein